MRPSKSTRSAVSAIVALCALMMTACGEAAITLDPGTQPSVTSDVPSPASSDPQATAAQAPAVTGLDGATLFGVAASGDRTVAVGADGDMAAAWSSDDRVDWRASTVTGDVPQLRGVAFSADEGIAFGGDDMEVSRVWVSQDGREWATGAESSGLEGRVNAVAADGDTWLAVGDRVDPESGESAGGRLWTSTDGDIWQASGDELTGAEGAISDVAVGDETVVIVGFDVAGGKIWAGTSGRLQPITGGQFDAVSIQGVAATDDGFVALGQSLGDLQPIAWISPDGISWTRVDLDPAAFPPQAEIHDMATVDDVLVAVGATPEGGVVWTSEDGERWTRGAVASDERG